MSFDDAELMVLSREKKQTMIIYFALTFFVVSFLGVVLVVGFQNQEARATDVGLMRSILVVISLVLMGLAYYFRFIRLRKLGHVPLPVASSEVVLKTCQNYRVGMIVACALAEAIVIYGVVLYYLDGNINSFLAFFAAGLLLLFFCRPSGNEVDHFASRQKEMAQAEPDH